MTLNKQLCPVALALLAAGVASAGEIRGLRERDVVRDQYIVVYKDAAQIQAMGIAASDSKVTSLAASHGRKYGLSFPQTFDRALRGALVRGNEAQARKLADDPTVAFVEADRVIRVGATQSSATWGLDRSDQASLPLNSSFTYPDQGGQGVHAYIIDTGVANHAEFSGRMGNGNTQINDGNGTSDCQGHGTHVAGTVAGTTWGFAKKATVHPVRVLGCDGSGTNSGVIAGMDWVASNHVKPAVANMSLGGGASSAVDQAVSNLVNAGVVTVVAAGNDNGDACSYSPARAASAITVGSTTSTDARSSFSNYGSCVDIFGPGSNITSAKNTGGSTTMSGTSMASPHVAGAAALYLGANPNATPASVTTALVNNSSANKISGLPSGTVNKLLNISFLNGSTPPPTTTPLQNDVPVTGVNFTAGQQRMYSLAVPSGANSLVFTSSGGSGDVDLYGKFANLPTSASYECKGDGPSTTETCTISNIQAGTYYLLADGYSASSNVTIKGKYATTTDTTPVLQNGVAVSNLSIATNGSLYYKVTLPAGRSTLTVTTSGGSGDVDLFVKAGSKPTTTSYSQKSDGPTNSETVTVNSPVAGDHYILLFGYSNVSGLSVRASW